MSMENSKDPQQSPIDFDQAPTIEGEQAPNGDGEQDASIEPEASIDTDKVDATETVTEAKSETDIETETEAKTKSSAEISATEGEFEEDMDSDDDTREMLNELGSLLEARLSDLRSQLESVEAEDDDEDLNDPLEGIWEDEDREDITPLDPALTNMSDYLASLSSKSRTFSPMKSDNDYQLVDKFSDKELVAILKDEGYTSVTVARPGQIKIRVNASSIMLINTDDGDLQCYYGVGGVKMSFKAINKWNRRYRLSRAYLDGDKDPILEADLMTSAGLTKRHVAEFMRVFVGSCQAFKAFLKKYDKS